jgi:hypothetical protein
MPQKRRIASGGGSFSAMTREIGNTLDHTWRDETHDRGIKKPDRWYVRPGRPVRGATRQRVARSSPHPNGSDRRTGSNKSPAQGSRDRSGGAEWIPFSEVYEASRQQFFKPKSPGS